MGSYGGHVLPGTFFLIFGFWYAIKYAKSYLRSRKSSPTGELFYCCRGRIPCSGMVIEGVVKIIFVSIGMLVELFYPGSPVGRLHDDQGNYQKPMNWQHATMYFFFGLSGVTDIIAFTAKRVIPPGLDRIGGALALFVEGYLFYFHLHGRSNIDTRVHILLVLTVWPSALMAFMECFVMTKRNALHVLEMFRSILIIAQGTWFWQTAYILYPPGSTSWDPCTAGSHGEHRRDMDMGNSDSSDCNEKGELNLMFITMFWTWHLAACFIFVGFIYFIIYQYLKKRGQLDPDYIGEYELVNGKLNSGSPLTTGLYSNGKAHPGTPLTSGLLSNGEEDDEL